jgi:ribosome-associated toxin RatA of RatAB toxin-antitoxin module
MPDVEMQINIQAPIDTVWQTVIDVERYPASMTNVHSVKILDAESPTVRRCAWSVTLKGSILEWVELEHLDPDRRTVEFNQLSGDMEVFKGHWALEALGPELTRVQFVVTFEIGIPLLAEMLNPVAQRSLRENCMEMLRGIEKDAVAV